MFFLNSNDAGRASIIGHDLTFDVIKSEIVIRALTAPNRAIIQPWDWPKRLSNHGAPQFMTAGLKTSTAGITSGLMQPAGIQDMLDYQLYLLYRDCGYVIERLCEVEFGASRRRWRILATLFAAEGITVSDLSKRAELDIAQTSRAIGTLVRQGYLKRLANPKNARYSEVLLTEKGRNLYRSMFARLCQVNAALLRDLSADQVQHLRTSISILRNTAGRLNASASSRRNSK